MEEAIITGWLLAARQQSGHWVAHGPRNRHFLDISFIFHFSVFKNSFSQFWYFYQCLNSFTLYTFLVYITYASLYFNFFLDFCTLEAHFLVIKVKMTKGAGDWACSTTKIFTKSFHSYPIFENCFLIWWFQLRTCKVGLHFEWGIVDILHFRMCSLFSFQYFESIFLHFTFYKIFESQCWFTSYKIKWAGNTQIFQSCLTCVVQSPLVGFSHCVMKKE